MSRLKQIIGLLAVSVLSLGHVHAAELAALKVLYIGDQYTPRYKQFTAFLEKHADKVAALPRNEFLPDAAEPFDVVVLDWPQSDATRAEWKKAAGPLGERNLWQKPTVLLGSAGLNLAVVWKVRGGSG